MYDTMLEGDDFITEDPCHLNIISSEVDINPSEKPSLQEVINSEGIC